MTPASNQPEPWAARYIGLRFVEHGRDRSGVDCWGLHRLVLKEVFGCECPSFDTGYVGCGRRDVEEIAALMASGHIGWHVVAQAPTPGALCPLGEERPGDSLLIRQYGVPCHVALVVGGGYMLHIEQDIDSVCEPYTERDWRRRIVAIYRHPQLGRAS